MRRSIQALAVSTSSVIAVASAAHARRGRDNPAGGFMQVGHGKLAPLKRIKAGDGNTFHYGRDYFGRLIGPLGCKCQRCDSGEA